MSDEPGEATIFGWCLALFNLRDVLLDVAARKLEAKYPTPCAGCPYAELVTATRAMGHDFGCPFGGRAVELIGDVVLSVQAGRDIYSWPAAGCSLVPLEEYGAVEVAMWWADRAARDARGQWVTGPSPELGLDGFQELWARMGGIFGGFGSQARYVPLEVVERLRSALAARAAAR